LRGQHVVAQVDDRVVGAEARFAPIHGSDLGLLDGSPTGRVQQTSSPGLADHDRLGDQLPFGLAQEVGVEDLKKDDRPERHQQDEQVDSEQQVADRPPASHEPLSTARIR
jgi:hypothetical protein